MGNIVEKEKTYNFKKEVTAKTEQDFSKYLSYLLRHHPEDVGLEMKDNGYVSTVELIHKINSSPRNKFSINLETLLKVVENDNKKRYSFKASYDDYDKIIDKYAYIRANQGHSIKGLMIDFELVENPPEYLYHGTSVENANKILKDGVIKSMSRQMVHLSKDVDTAVKVGKRHGMPHVFTVDVKKALEAGKKFYKSENGVYLVDSLETELLK